MTTASEDAQRIAGTYIADDTSPKPPLLAWIQAECRTGCFRDSLEEVAREQAEPLNLDLALVESISLQEISVRVPCRVSDHENPSTFESDVFFLVNPVSLAVRRP